MKLAGISFRPISSADVPFLGEMLYQAIFVPPGMPAPAKKVVATEPLARYVRGWGQPDDLGLVALNSQNQQPVGAAWLRCFPPTQKGYGFVDAQIPELSIALLPEFRGQGIGTQLLTGVLELAQSCYKAVSLSVSTENPAMRLYQRHGFAIFHEEKGSATMLKQF